MFISGVAFQQPAQGKTRVSSKDDDGVTIPRTAFYCQGLKVNLSPSMLQMEMQS